MDNLGFLRKRPIRLGILAVSALLLALSVMYPALGGLAWFASVPFACVLFCSLEEESRFRQRLLDLVVFFGVYFLILYHWFFYMYPLDFLGVGKGAAAVVVVAAWFGLSILAGVPAVALFLLWKPLGSSAFVRRHRLLLPFFAAALWTVLEWLTTLTFAGVPWSRLALGQTKMLAMIQTASWFGSYFITFLIVAVNFLLAYVICYRKHVVLALPIVLVALNLMVGGVMLSTYEVQTGEPIRAAAVQGNTPSNEKWALDKLVGLLERHKAETEAAIADGAELVVYSETAIPICLPNVGSVLAYCADIAAKGDCLLLVGAFDKGADGEQYNALFLLDRDGTLAEDRYYKRHLVPFGEYMPMRALAEALIPPLADINAVGEDLSSGHGSQLITTEYGEIGALICFDSIYEELARKSVKDGAALLVLSTNDSWFADSAALAMHNAQAILRAVENRRYIVRAANTGISSVISPTGEVLSSLGADRVGYLCENVYMHEDITLYTATGNLFVLVCGVYLTLIFGVYLIKKKKAACERLHKEVDFL